MALICKNGVKVRVRCRVRVRDRIRVRVRVRVSVSSLYRQGPHFYRYTVRAKFLHIKANHR